MKWAWFLGAVAAVAIVAGVAAQVARTPAEQSAISRPPAVSHADPTDDDMDELLFEQMVSAGLDLATPRPLAFALYFEEEREARGACDALARDGMAARLEPPQESDTWWLCRATKEMVPSRDAIHAEREKMKRVAEAWNGEYDGWEPASAQPEQN